MYVRVHVLRLQHSEEPPSETILSTSNILVQNTKINLDAGNYR